MQSYGFYQKQTSKGKRLIIDMI